jgi:hypothetical protein
VVVDVGRCAGSAMVERMVWEEMMERKQREMESVESSRSPLSFLLEVSLRDGCSHV